ncbi:MAG TPA: peptide-methionine (R)-S-oxide reductase MsrB [Chthoniobacterales bacterium]|jgi:peptide methionine sulfoxide reductase msrA/msrB|nr:peptide-methionine (R)-S-oxide reductase MsrB [Chthoniobacterales bacterium]
MNGGRITSEERSSLSSYVAIAVAVILTSLAVYFLVLTQKEKRETTGFDPNRPIPSDTVLKQRLKPIEYFVVRENGSETPFQNEYWNNERPGIYVDVIDGQPLFTSVDKYDSGLGIPAFSKPIKYDLVVEKPDNSDGMQRIEVRSKRSDAHLGHLFGDPKSPTGRRYAIQSAALHFIPKEEMASKGYEAELSLLDKK